MILNSQNQEDNHQDHEHLEEEWGIVSLDGEEPTDNRRSGVLILSGDEASTEEENRFPAPADDISIPGTDSIPSEIDTLDIGSGINVSNNDETWRPDDEETAHSESRVTKNRKKSLLLVLMATVVMSLVGYLVHESRSLKIQRMRLEEDKLRLEEELRKLKEETNKAKPTVVRNVCAGSEDGWQEDSDESVLADNCYFRLTLRDCGKNMKKNWNDWANGAYESFDHFNKKAWNFWGSTDEDESKSDEEKKSNKMYSMASDAVSSTMVAVHNAFNEMTDNTREFFHEMNIVVDESMIRVKEMAREAIDDATAPTRPE